MAKTKFFRVAVEGATVDGRTIERNWLTEMAASYNRETYSARVNMEHIRGVTADKPFKAFGDVLSLKTDTIELELGGKKQKKLALFAEVEPTDDLVAMNRDKQKLFTSIEVNPNFADTGKAYLVGLAVTDSPASLGTEALTFAVQHPGAIRNAPQLQAAGNVFSTGLETRFELDEAATPPADAEAGLFAALTGLITKLTKGSEPVTPPAPPAPPAPSEEPGSGAANDNDPRFALIADGLTKLTSAVQTMSGSVTALRSDHDALKASIENTEQPGQGKRPPATGGNGKANYARAEC
jgi:hypothetical protein